jgi:NADH-quinone oxidoreductase subunit L
LENALTIALLFSPLVCFVLLFENNVAKSSSGGIATVISIFSLTIGAYLLCLPDSHSTFTWLESGGHKFDIALRADKTAKIMALLVNFIALMVNVYSITYMKGEKHYHKYFAYIGLFTFSMLGIVLFDNLLFIYGFWELVGLSSYLVSEPASNHG